MDTYKSLQTFHFSEEIKKRHSGKSLRAVIFGNFGAMNYGDEAILAGEIAELQKMPDVAITVVSRYPDAVKKLHHVNAVSQYAFGSVVNEINRADFIIVGGGGLINKVERGIVGFAYQLYMLSVFFGIPQLYRKDVYALGIGVYSNANPLILALAKMLLEKAKIVTVRDEHSYSTLSSSRHAGGVQHLFRRLVKPREILDPARMTVKVSVGEKIEVKLYKDNSFLMDLVPVADVLKDEYFKTHYDKKRVNIGISLLKPEDKAEEERLLAEVSEFIIQNQKSADFWLYPADSNPAYVNDGEFGKKLIEKVQSAISNQQSANQQIPKINFVPSSWHPQRFFSSFALMDYFVSMRLHTSIFSYRNKIKFTGISYDTKCASFLTSVGKKPVEVKDVRWEELQKELRIKN
jgi:hypothetical protein